MVADRGSPENKAISPTQSRGPKIAMISELPAPLSTTTCTAPL
jgi:hypothetical protein